VYVEYSNETWNGFFSASSQTRELVNARLAANINDPLNYDGKIRDNDPTTQDNELLKVHRFTAQRIRETSNIFRGVFGDSEMPSGTNSTPRIRPIYEYQYENLNGSATNGLDFLNNYYNNADGVQHVTTPRPSLTICTVLVVHPTTTIT
jgi:hypothetical protein